MRRIWSAIRALYLSYLIAFLHWASTLEARTKLKTTGPITVLIDSSVLVHGTILRSGHIDTGPRPWGNLVVPTGYAAAIPTHSPSDDSIIAREARYLAGIARLVREGHIRLVTSGELYAEAIRQPSGRFRGYGYHDLNVFHGIFIPSIDGHVPFSKRPKEDQLARVAGNTDAKFAKVRSLLPVKSSLDAWHLHTVEKHSLYCFLTIDERLTTKVSALMRSQLLPPEARAMLPSELGKELGIRPLPTNIFQAREGVVPPHVGIVFGPNHRFRPDPESGRMTIYGEAIAGAGPVATVNYDSAQEAMVKKLPAVSDMKGLKFDHSTSTAILTYQDANGQWLELDVPLPQAMFLLSLVKGLQLNLDIPFPDDPRDATSPLIRPSEREHG